MRLPNHAWAPEGFEAPGGQHGDCWIGVRSELLDFQEMACDSRGH
jgi:hypothetical protein